MVQKRLASAEGASLYGGLGAYPPKIFKSESTLRPKAVSTEKVPKIDRYFLNSTKKSVVTKCNKFL